MEQDRKKGDKKKIVSEKHKKFKRDPAVAVQKFKSLNVDPKDQSILDRLLDFFTR